MQPICSFPDCGAARASRGLCVGHYTQWYKGQPLTPIVRGVLARFWLKVDKSAECWLWTGTKGQDGYGQFNPSHSRQVRAHRFAYELLRGPIPEGLTLDHLCRNHACVNPEHLEAVDSRTNTLRGDGITAENARKTHCAQGHEFTDDNTYSPPHKRERCCRICRRNASDRYNKRRRG